MKRPFPWFWLVRLVASIAFALAWGLLYPGAAIWQLFLAGFAGAAVMDGLRLGFRREQDDITARRRRRLP